MLFADSSRDIEQYNGATLYYNKSSKRWTVDVLQPELERKTFKSHSSAKEFYEKTTSPPISPRQSPSPHSRWKQSVAALLQRTHSAIDSGKQGD